MQGIAFISRKGGSGKTSLAHALALGAAWRGVPAHLMHTDDRQPIAINGRPYLYYDARKPETLQTLVSSAINADGLCIIDGGGNRPQFDKFIASFVDLALIPVTPDPEDVHEALVQYAWMTGEGMNNVFFVLNKYPRNIQERTYIGRYLNDLPADKIIAQVSEVKAIRRLREGDAPAGFETLPSKVNNLARRLYLDVLEVLEGVGEG